MPRPEEQRPHPNSVMVPGTILNIPPRPHAPQPEAPAAYYVSVVRRSGSKIFSFVILALAVTYGISSLITPSYEATAVVDVDLRMPAGLLGAESQQTAMLDSEQFMATQMKLIQSDAVLRDVTQQYHLLELEKQDRAAIELPAAVFQNAPVVLKNLRVNRPPNTFLIQISYRSPDRELSSSVANSIAGAYIRHTYALRVQSVQGISAFMEKEQEQLKARMEKSSDRLAAFERDLNVADPEQKTAILSSRLIQMNNEYASAEADRLRKEAAFHSMQEGSVEAAQTSTQGEALKQLTERLSQAKERFAAIRGLFGKNFPDYRKAALEVDELLAQVDQTRGSVSKRVEIEYKEAANRERMLSEAVAGLKHEFDGLNARTFEYQTLKRDAEADRKLYEELDQKIREASINAGFQNSSVRLADPARPPLKPVAPNTKMNLLLALCFSMCGSVVVAVAADKREATVSDPESTASNLQIRVAGSLPRVSGKGVTPVITSGTAAKTSSMLDRFMYDEAILSLRSAILLAPENHSLRCLAVTSPLPGDGKTATACHLATANARKGKRTLLVDFDLRRPMVDRCLGVDPAHGMKDVLLGKADWRSICREVSPFFPLDVLSIGASDFELATLAGSEMTSILMDARTEYDLVVVDCPPILGFSVPLEIGAIADCVLLIAVAGETNSRLLSQCITSLRQVGATNLCLAINKVSSRNSDNSYYGNYMKRYKRYSRSS